MHIEDVLYTKIFFRQKFVTRVQLVDKFSNFQKSQHLQITFNQMHRSRVARFFWCNIPKRGKIYLTTIKYIKWLQILPNGCKILQMDIKYIYLPTFSILRPSNFYPNLDLFWFENIPSGNPAQTLFLRA
jgi:hypothetical protein